MVQAAEGSLPDRKIRKFLNDPYVAGRDLNTETRLLEINNAVQQPLHVSFQEAFGRAQRERGCGAYLVCSNSQGLFHIHTALAGQSALYACSATPGVATLLDDCWLWRRVIDELLQFLQLRPARDMMTGHR